jgi:hypothetical protein
MNAKKLFQLIAALIFLMGISACSGSTEAPLTPGQAACLGKIGLVSTSSGTYNCDGISWPPMQKHVDYCSEPAKPNVIKIEGEFTGDRQPYFAQCDIILESAKKNGTQDVPATATATSIPETNTPVPPTEMPATATSEPTSAPAPSSTPNVISIHPSSSCPGVTLIKHEGIGTVENPIYNDTTAGDLKYSAIAYSWNALDEGTGVVSFVPAGTNNDIQRTGAITGFVEYYDGTEEAVTCVANRIANQHPGAYMFYAGFGYAPDGWSVSQPNGWIMTVTEWPFDEQIYVAGANWTDGILDSKNVKNTVRTGPGEYSEIQWWDGADSNKAIHVMLGPNSCVQTSTLQGKHWIVSGDFNVATLVSRFLQMSAERIKLDKIKSPIRVDLIGGILTQPAGWTTNLPPSITTCGR